MRTDTFTTATPRIDAWGHFHVLLEDGPPGFVEFHVGGPRPDGSWEVVLLKPDLR